MNLLPTKPWLYIAIFIFLSVGTLQAQVINTVAGTGATYYSGDGGPAINASFAYMQGMTRDAQGNTYICEKYRVRKIDVNGIITTIVGTGTSGFMGDGGLATAAKVNNVIDVAVDAIGNIYILDIGNGRIRKIAAGTGIITTIAGDGQWWTPLFGSPAIDVSIGSWSVSNIEVDNNGFVYFTTQAYVVKINSAGITEHIAGNGSITYNGDGIPATTASLYGAGDILFDAGGNMYIADKHHNRVRKVDANGIISTVAGNGIFGYPAFYPITATSTSIGWMMDIALDANGNLYILAYTPYNGFGCNYVSVVNTQGMMHYYISVNPTDFYGDGGCALLAKFDDPHDLSTDVAGNVYITDAFNHRLRKVDSSCIYASQPDSIIGDDSVCAGTTQVYSIPPVAGATSYQWTLPNGWTGASTTNSITVTVGSQDSAITVAALNNCGVGYYQLLNIHSVTLMADAELGMFSNDSICTGQYTNLTHYTNNYYASPQWTKDGIYIPGAIYQTYTASTTGDYAVKLSYEGCTVISDTIPINVFPYPDAPVIPDTNAVITFCGGDTVILSTPSSGYGLTYQWYSGGGAIPGETDTVYQAYTWGNYRIQVTYLGVCPTMSNYVHLDDFSPYAYSAIAGNDDLCMGSVQLSTSGTSGFSYQWYVDGIAIPGATITPYSPSIAGNYTVVITHDSLGCGDSSDAVTVYGLPVPVIIVSDTTICPNGNAALMVPSIGNSAFQWQESGNNISGATSSSFNTTQAGSYTVAVTHGTCADTSAPVTISIVPTPAPTITMNTNTLSVPAVYNSYQWYLNGISIPGATGNSYTALQDGNYFVRVTDDECTGYSDTVSVTGLSVANTNNSIGLGLYPNPNNGMFTIKGIVQSTEDLQLLVIDVLGRTISKHVLPVRNNIVNEIIHLGNSIPAGNYLLKILGQHSTQVLSVQKH